MLRTNLSTRPFYNVRAVQLALGALGVLALAFTLVNVVQIVRLSASERTLGTHAQDAEAEATRLRADAARIRARIDPAEVQRLEAAAREANAIIARRAFSWTGLMARIEATLPAGARVTRVQPRERDGHVRVVLDVEARRPEDLHALFEALEADGAFRQVLALQQQRTDSGLWQAVVEGVYGTVEGPEAERAPGGQGE